MIKPSPQKIALLIGVSKYEGDLPQLPGAPNDVEAMKQVLEAPDWGWFDQVDTLIDPDPTAMRRAIGKLFRKRHRDDLLLLYFAGHGLLDENDRLYLATPISNSEEVKETSLSASFIHNSLNSSRCKRKIVILDCCYSGAFAENWIDRGSENLDFKKEFGGEGQAVLTSSSSAQKSFEQEGAGIYTSYLVEGLKGGADKNRDGIISIQELHDYAKEKVIDATDSKMKPEIYLFKDGSKIILTQAGKKGSEIEYRQWVERYVVNGELSEFAYLVLKAKRKELGLTDEQAEVIENKVLEPFKQKGINLEKYKQAFAKAVEKDYPLDDHTRRIFKDYQGILGLENDDITWVESEVIKASQRLLEAQKKQEEEEYKGKLQTYQQEFLKVVAAEYPLSGVVCQKLKELQQSLGLKDKDIISIEKPIIAEKEKAKKPRFEFDIITVDAQGKEINGSRGGAEYLAKDLGEGVTLEMVAIPGGKFMMGTEDEEIERLCKKFNWDRFRREKPRHEVTIKPFYMGKYQVTQAQWRRIANLPKINDDLDPNPARFKGDSLPVEQVSWNDAVEFCRRLSKATGKEYRLPSEAEWEYACRAIQNSKVKSQNEEISQSASYPPFHFGETLTDKLANYDASYTYANEAAGEYRGKTTPVGSFPPNAFGLYDMHGNVWEWCADDYHENYEKAPQDGSAWLNENENDYHKKLVRGGSWYLSPAYCRSASPNYDTRGFDSSFIGFRGVWEVPSTLSS